MTESSRIEIVRIDCPECGSTCHHAPPLPGEDREIECDDCLAHYTISAERTHAQPRLTDDDR